MEAYLLKSERIDELYTIDEYATAGCGFVIGSRRDDCTANVVTYVAVNRFSKICAYVQVEGFFIKRVVVAPPFEGACLRERLLNIILKMSPKKLFFGCSKGSDEYRYFIDHGFCDGEFPACGEGVVLSLRESCMPYRMSPLPASSGVSSFNAG